MFKIEEVSLCLSLGLWEKARSGEEWCERDKVFAQRGAAGGGGRNNVWESVNVQRV